MNRTLKYIALALVASLATACISDDSDLSQYMNGGTTPPDPEIVPIEIALDYSELAEDDDVVPTDMTDPFYNDYFENDDFVYDVYIDYDETGATVSGMLSRVYYTVEGGHVTLTSTSGKMHFILSGECSDASLKVYSENKYMLTLNDVNITNPNGAAINNQCGKSLYLMLPEGTNNTLTDGANYVYDGDEDMKGTLFSEGQVIFAGRGTLNVNSNSRNGIASDDYIRVRPGVKINVNSTAGHGIKANDGVMIDGGVINMQISAEGAKGIRCEKHVEIAGGRTTIIATGGSKVTQDALLAENDTTSSAGIKCDSILTVTGGLLAIKNTGESGKGINALQDITISGGVVKVVVTGEKMLLSPKGIKCGTVMTITGGSVYSYSAFSDPIDADAGWTTATGYTEFTNVPRLFYIIYP